MVGHLLILANVPRGTNLEALLLLELTPWLYSSVRTTDCLCYESMKEISPTLRLKPSEMSEKLFAY